MTGDEREEEKIGAPGFAVFQAQLFSSGSMLGP